MPSEKTKRMGHVITYVLAAIVLFAMYATSKTTYGLLGGILCVGLAVKNLLDWQNLRRREKEETRGEE